MHPKRFRFVSPGEVVVGVVLNHKMKPVKSIRDLHRDQILVSTKGREDLRATASYKDGFATVYSEYCGQDNMGVPDLVDLSNPELQILELSNSTTVFRIEP